MANQQVLQRSKSQQMLQELQRVLQAQANSSAVTISAETITDAKLIPVDGFDTKLQSGLVLKTPPLISTSERIPDPSDDNLVFSGTTKYLGVQDLPVTLTFTVDESSITSLSLDITIPKGWSFADDGTLYGTEGTDAHYTVTVNSDEGSYQLSGGAATDAGQFQAIVALSAKTHILIGAWSDQDRGLIDILKALGFPDPGLPSGLDLTLASGSIAHDVKGEFSLITATSKTYGPCSFAVIPIDGDYQFFFNLGVNETFSLSNLPLVGKELADIENVRIGDIQIFLSSAVSSDDQYTNATGSLNPLIDAVNQDTGDTYPEFPKTAPAKLLQLEITLKLGSSEKKTLSLDLAIDGVHWLKVQKSFGPVSIERIGATYQLDRQLLWFEIDATLAVGPVTMQLVGLGLGCPLTSFKPEFSLMGLAVSYSAPPLSLAGSLANLAPPGADYIEFEGGVSIGTGEFSLIAFGYYGNKNSFSSFFIYGDVAYDFGDPPIIITGLALGFGYNSGLRIPTVDEVEDFPFIEVLPTSLVPNTGLFGDTNPTPQAVLDEISNTAPPWVTPQQGSLWFAGGITFNTAGVVDSQALVLVEFGKDLVIALTGTARAQFPEKVEKDIPVYAYIELDLDVMFAPTQGIFSCEAVLSNNSFLLDKACVLTGGFAFFLWYGSNPHAGDFVITLGGYNPGFTPPSHYPKVSAVGFHWSLDSSINVSGGAYFAITPSALMVGGELNTTYQSGNLKAWFDAHADIIVQWKPFWIDAAIGITVGASYKISVLFVHHTVSVELGCNLELWGPPTGGKVHVSWFVISFTIHFGSSKSSSQPQLTEWSQVQAMLPNSGTPDAPNVLTLSPASGITPITTSPANADSPDSTWFVRGSQFSFTTSSSIPASEATVGGSHQIYGSQFNVAPLGWTNISASHTVTIHDGEDHDLSSAFSVVPAFRNLPAQLWGTQSSSTPDPANQLVPHQLAGLAISVNPPEIGGSAGAVNVAVNLAYVDLEIANGLIGVSAMAQPAGDTAVNDPTTLSKIADSGQGIGSSAAAAARATIYSAISGLNYAPQTKNDAMTNFASQAGCSFAAAPLLVA